MNKILMFVIFFTIFFGIYFGMHYYAYYRIIHLFDIKNTMALFIIVFSMALSFPIASILEHFISNIITRIIYTISASWLGVIFFLFSTLLIYEILKYFIKIDSRLFGFIIIGFVGLISLIALISALFVVVKDVEVPIKGIDKEITIVQLSDMHVGTVRNSGYVEKIIRKTNELKPDIVVITGDFLDGGGILHEKIFIELKKLNSPTYFVIGNHEVYDGDKMTNELVEKTNIIRLNDEAVMINGIQLVGVNDPGNQNGHISIKKIKYDKDKPTVLLRHQPALVEEAASQGIDLQISGHTHNGQIIPFNLAVRGAYKYTKGLYKIGDMHLYVSPGTGTWGPPMRLGSLNEITHFKLIPDK